MTEHVSRAFDGPVTAVRCLLIPGLNDSGAGHWQTAWRDGRDDCSRVELGDWTAPTRTGWVARIGEAVDGAQGPVVLVAHSLGCLAVAWWAMQATASAISKVAGAMLVAPPDVGQQGCDLRVLRFAPAPAGPLPFRTLMVASGNDPYASVARSRLLAERWGAAFVDLGRVGHVNAASDLGDWQQGQALLASLIGGLPQ